MIYDIKLRPTYIIVGITPDGTEHFISSSFGMTTWFTMFLRSMKFRFNKKYTDRYTKIKIRSYYDD